MNIIRIEINDTNAIIKTSTEGLNTNKKSLNKAVFYYSLKYINIKPDEIIKLLTNIEQVSFEDEESFIALSRFLKCKKIIFNFKDSLKVSVLNLLLEIETLKEINCYFIPSDYIHEFSQKNISIIFNNDFSFDSNFVKYNDLNSLKDIYYKKQLNFYSKREINNNLEYFLNINKKLKVINLYYYSLESIKYIVKTLKTKRISNIKIIVHQTEDNNIIISNDIKELKKLNKSYFNNIKILYDEEYFNNRIFKLLTINGMKLTCILFMYVGLVLLISTAYKEQYLALELRKLESEITDNIVWEDVIINQIDEIDDTSENTTETTENNIIIKEVINKYDNIPSAFDKLESINNDFVGWIKVNNTMINYPVLKHDDNNYYLSHDIYLNKTTTGWIFMDYRNMESNLNKNTIIYGHALKSGLMFGTLYKTASESWIKNEENLIISLKTKYEDNRYKIFSIYKIDETTDYLRVNFIDNNEFLSFVNMIKKRSIYEFDTKIKEDDKILTLSTCSGNNRRLVVHAVKIVD